MARIAAQIAQNLNALFDPGEQAFRWNGKHLRRDAVLNILFAALLILLAIFYVLRYIHLGADFDTAIQYTEDGVLYTDEGWYAGNAIHYFQTGQWHYPGDLNFAVNLPVLQVLHGISFYFAGIGIVAARCTIIACMTLLLALVYTILWRLEDKWTALAAVLIVLSNYFFFLYSRLAIAEIPMTLFVTLSLILAWTSTGKLGWFTAAAAGLLAAIAVYTKTSAIFALPLLTGIVIYRNWTAGERRAAFLKILPAGALFILIACLHTLFLARPYAEDYAYFAELNVGMNLQHNPFNVLDYWFGLIGRMRLMDNNLFVLFQAAPIPLLLLSRTFRRNPLVIISIVYFVVYTMMFSLYANPRPRYWIPLLVPLCILTALIGKHFFIHARRHWPLKLLFFAWVLLIAASATGNAAKIFHYLRNAQYTWQATARSVKAHMDADGIDNNFLLGHFSTTFVLYDPEIRPINDRYASGPLEQRLEKFDPRWLITRDSIHRRDSEEEIANDYPGSYEERLAILQNHYAKIEEIEIYNTLDAYKGDKLYLYRLSHAE